MSKPTFKPFSDFLPGTIYSLLIQSYSSHPTLVDAEKTNWQRYDDEVYSLPETVGRCGFISAIDTTPIGFASWDPRNKPEFAIIGHNCILPEYRGNGYGTAQVKETLRRLERQGFAVVKVSTGVDDFFIPARKMCATCGFVEVAKSVHKRISGFKTVNFEKQL